MISKRTLLAYIDSVNWQLSDLERDVAALKDEVSNLRKTSSKPMTDKLEHAIKDTPKASSKRGRGRPRKNK